MAIEKQLNYFYVNKDNIITYSSNILGRFSYNFNQLNVRKLSYINIAIKAYFDRYLEKEGIGYYPINLEFDIFGFSRGAALARHFVNVIKEHGVDYNKEFYYNPAKIRVKTLNIFDTVASFGKPGNDINIGFNLHIKPSFIVDKVNHFLADDEFRENFPAHLISNTNKNYPININDTKNKFEELVFLGAPTLSLIDF